MPAARPHSPGRTPLPGDGRPGRVERSNFLVTIMVARLVGPSEFGAFSVAPHRLPPLGWRAVLGEPCLSAHSATSGRSAARAAGRPAAGGLVTSVLASAGHGGGGGLAIGGDDVRACWRMACVFPFLGIQDALRYVAVVDRPRWPWPATWRGSAAVVAPLAVAPDGASAAWFAVAWGRPAWGAGRWPWPDGRPPAAGNARRWLQEHREMAGAFLAEAASAPGR